MEQVFFCKNSFIDVFLNKNRRHFIKTKNGRILILFFAVFRTVNLLEQNIYRNSKIYFCLQAEQIQNKTKRERTVRNTILTFLKKFKSFNFCTKFWLVHLWFLFFWIHKIKEQMLFLFRIKILLLTRIGRIWDDFYQNLVRTKILEKLKNIYFMSWLFLNNLSLTKRKVRKRIIASQKSRNLIFFDQVQSLLDFTCLLLNFSVRSVGVINLNIAKYFEINLPFRP